MQPGLNTSELTRRTSRLALLMKKMVLIRQRRTQLKRQEKYLKAIQDWMITYAEVHLAVPAPIFNTTNSTNSCPPPSMPVPPEPSSAANSTLAETPVLPPHIILNLETAIDLSLSSN